MKRQITLSAAFALGTAAPFSVSAADANTALKSTYTNTASCVTVEEGENRFTLRCPAPSGGIHAILSYWDGRAFVAYEPYYKRGDKARLRTVAADAPRAFGQKIEWRMRDGEQTGLCGHCAPPHQQGRHSRCQRSCDRKTSRRCQHQCTGASAG